MLEEFKKFAMRGNVIDLAVGVIIGAAFGAIVSSLVADIIMPIIGAVTGGPRFLELLHRIVLEGAAWPVLRRREEARCGSRLGAIPHRRVKLCHYRVGAILRHQGDHEAEEGGAGRARSWPNGRG